jgi:hypothetical protein
VKNTDFLGGREEIQNNKPNIIFVGRGTKKAYILDRTIPNSVNIIKTTSVQDGGRGGGR